MTHDIFVSYARKDLARVRVIVRVLEARGWSVWWDPEILPGQEFHDVIQAALDHAKAIVVVWSEHSTSSRWVRNEAAEGLDREILVAIRLDAMKPPIHFRGIHTIDLFDEGLKEASLAAVVLRLEQLLQRDPRTRAPARSGSAPPARQPTVARRSAPEQIPRPPPGLQQAPGKMPLHDAPRASAPGPQSRRGKRLLGLSAGALLLVLAAGWVVRSSTSSAAPDLPERPSSPGPLVSAIDAASGSSFPEGWEIVDATHGFGGWAREVREPRSGIVFRLVDPGEFVMGSPLDEQGRHDDETRHRVRMTKPYYLGVTEVTRGQWGGVRRKDVEAGEFPVTGINWFQARQFCNDIGCDLPTEAQWEYAARAGRQERFWWGDKIEDFRGKANVAWFDDVPLQVARAGASLANPFGFRDMIGNLWEWCLDGYRYELPGDDVVDPITPPVGSGRVVRGGSFDAPPSDCRAASRVAREANESLPTFGFRAALTVE